MAKECCVVILDVGRSMGRMLDHAAQKTGLDYAKDAFRLMVQQKLLFGGKRDEMCLVLLNSTDTINITNEVQGQGYEHISNIWHLQTPSLDLLEKIDTIQQEDGRGDVLDSLVVAAQLIVERVKHLKFTKRVFLLTDAGEEIHEQEHMDQIAASFIGSGITLNVIGIGFGEEADEDEDDDGDVDMEGDIKIVGGDPNRSETVRQNEITLREFARKSHSNVFSCKNAVQMLSEMRSKSVLQRPAFSGELEITDELSITIKLFTRCREQTMPSLKKESTLGDDTKGVQMDRVYKNKFRQGEDDEEVTEEERVKSFLYGKQRIPFSEADLENMTYSSGAKHFKLLGFVASDKVKRSHFMGPVLMCIAEAENVRDCVALSGFVRACHEKNYCGLARLVTAKNRNPKFVVLEPRIKTSVECFLINELPFYEDIRRYPFASFTLNKQYAVSQEQLTAARNLVTSLDLMQAEFDEDGDPIEALRPNNTFNPILQRYYQNVQARALDAEQPIQELEPMIAKTLEPPADMFNRAGDALDEFKRSFEFKIIPKKEAKKQKKHWSDVSDEIDNLLSGLAPDGMKLEEKNDDVDMDVDFDDMLQVDSVKVIGTQNPVQDFDTLLKKRSSPDLFQNLCKQMWKIIGSLVDGSFQDMSYPKVLGCIEHMRKSCIMEEEPFEFNKGLREFKNRYEPKKKPLWALMVEKRMTLVSQGDFEDGLDGLDVSPQDSEDFLFRKEVQAVVAAPSIEIDSDDELDELV